jgi:hypothetical protein
MASKGSGSPGNVTYEALNDAVNRTYFDGRDGSLPVYLDMEQQRQEELARRLGVEQADIDVMVGETVERTLCWGTSNVYSFHCDAKADWEDAGRVTPPPFSALLLTLSLAAGRMRADAEFSSNNYYQRLVHVLHVDQSESAARRDALAHSAKYTSALWESLNGWLTQNDYVFGQPTADDFNSTFRYVYFAVSQSLIREVDRQRLRQMFANFGLSRRNKISPREMRLCLLSWIKGANGPTPSLRRMAANDQLIDRLVDTALAELELFDGVAASAPGIASSQRLFWVIFERRFPRSQLRLHLATANLSQDLCDLEQLDATEVSHLAPRLRLESRGPADIQCLGPAELLNLERLFYGAVRVRSRQGLDFSHDPSPIIPLKRREDAPYWQEVPRIEPRTRHIVICHEKWEERVKAYLDDVAESGHIAIPRGADPGFLPTGWLAFRDVVITRTPPREVAKDLQVLVPMFSGKELHCSGGLPLARNIWHASAPPVVHLETDSAPRNIALERAPGKSFEIDPASYDSGFLEEYAGNTLEGKNLRLVFKGAQWRLAQALSFRSANTPRWLSEAQRTSLTYALGGSAANVLSAEDDRGQPGIQGHATRGISAAPPVATGLARAARINGTFANEEDQGPRYDRSAISGVEGTCILRGHHYWLVDDANTHLQCRDCRKFLWITEYRAARARPRTRRTLPRPSKVASAAAMVVTAPAHDMHAEAPADENVVTADVLYDAACYLGGGSMVQLQSLLAHVHRDPLELSSACRALVDLALIDTQLDDNLSRPARWSIPPPCLTLVSEGRMFLSGFRSSDLLSQLNEVLKEFECTHTRIAQTSAPAAHFWTVEGLAADDIREIVDGIRDPFSRPVAVEDQLAQRLIAALPPIGATIQSLNPIHISPTEEVERFDVASGRWHEGRLDAPGAYRARIRGSQYFFHDGSASFAAPYELAKLLAARLDRRYLHAYEDGTFRCVIGCEPPGLFRRALVACSGLLPTRGGGAVTYSRVDETIADSILEKLYG